MEFTNNHDTEIEFTVAFPAFSERKMYKEINNHLLYLKLRKSCGTDVNYLDALFTYTVFLTQSHAL